MALDPEQLGGAGLVTIAGSQGTLDHAAFNDRERNDPAIAATATVPATAVRALIPRSGAHRFGQICSGQVVALGQHEGLFRDVSQFSHIARPGVGFQRGLRTSRESLDRLLIQPHVSRRAGLPGTVRDHPPMVASRADLAAVLDAQPGIE